MCPTQFCFRVLRLKSVPARSFFFGSAFVKARAKAEHIVLCGETPKGLSALPNALHVVSALINDSFPSNNHHLEEN